MRLDEQHDLITQMVQGLYDAENQLILALPRVALRAARPELREALIEHLRQTREHASRLEEVADALGICPTGKKCLAMEGILKEGEEVMGFGGDESLVDAAIMASCQGVEMYEISQYRSLRDLLAAGGEREVASFVEATLSEEEAASKKIAQLSEMNLKNSHQLPTGT